VAAVRVAIERAPFYAQRTATGSLIRATIAFERDGAIPRKLEKILLKKFVPEGKYEIVTENCNNLWQGPM
jgi:hypothetical protein